MPTIKHPEPTSARVSAVMRGNRRRDTKPEVAVRSALHRLGLRFRKDHAVEVPGLRVRPDVVFPREQLAVFVDGCFWHCCPTHGTRPRRNRSYWDSKLRGNVRRDRLVTRGLTDADWVVIRVWEHTPAQEAATIIVQQLEVVRKRMSILG